LHPWRTRSLRARVTAGSFNGKILENTVDNRSAREAIYSVSEEEREQRIDMFLASREKELTRSRIQSLIKDLCVQVNGIAVKASHRLRAGDQVRFIIPGATPSEIMPEPVAFSLIHEDAWLIVLDKPPGLVVHPAPGHLNGTLVHGLLHHCRNLSGIGGVQRPGIVHRLDKDTSGLLVVAKNDQAHTGLSRQFKDGGVVKRYFALVHGVMPGEKGEIDLPISRHPVHRKEMAVVKSGGKRALTLWKRLDVIGGRFTLLEVTLKTGRTHQIRVHLSHQGYPILGDQVYGPKSTWWNRQCPEGIDIASGLNRQMLHSGLLGFIHPGTGEYCEFKSPIAPDMQDIIKGLKGIFNEGKGY
jgi:23S rRNA pseudouridine1911/1915/1917 synthase